MIMVLIKTMVPPESDTGSESASGIDTGIDSGNGEDSLSCEDMDDTNGNGNDNCDCSDNANDSSCDQDNGNEMIMLVTSLTEAVLIMVATARMIMLADMLMPDVHVGTHMLVDMLVPCHAR